MLKGKIGNQLIDLYSQKFPKRCNNCGKTYKTRNEYLKATYPMRDRRGTIFEVKKVQEYRNCICGSTLLILTDDRRDNSKFGYARRELFDRCLADLKKITEKDEESLKIALREIFRIIIRKSQHVESLDNLTFRDVV